MPQRIKVIGIAHPFRFDYRRASVPVGLSVRGCLEASGCPDSWAASAVVYLNDQRVPREWWSRVRPKAGSTLTYRVMPQGGLLRSILVLGVIVAAAFLGPLAAGALGPILGIGIGTAGAAALSAGISAGIGITGSLLVNALVPIRTPHLGLASGANPAVSGGGAAAASPTFSLTQPQNGARPWGPIPVIFGRHRVYPPFGAKPYTEIVGDDQYLRVLFVLGVGPIQIDDLRLGDNPLGNYQHIELEWREGYPSDAPIALYPGQVFETPLSVALTEVAGFQTQTTAANIDEFSIDITFPSLGQLGADGSLLTASVNIAADYRQVGSGTWLPLISPSVEVIVEAQSFFLGSAWETGPSGDPGSIGYRVWLTLDGRLELHQGPLSPLNAPVFPDGPVGEHFKIVRITVSGDTVANITQELDPNLTGFAATNPSAREIRIANGFYTGEATFEGATRSAVRRTYAHRVDVRGQYEIRVRRVTLDSTAATIFDECFWTAIRAFRYDPVLNSPKPLATLVLRIRASEQLNGMISDFNCLAVSVLPDWDGANWVTRPTANPAAHFRAVLQGPAAPRAMSDSRIDFPSLQAWSTYCVTKSFAFNMVRDFTAPWWDVLLDICSAGRASLALPDWKWGVFVDELRVGEAPQQHFTPRNSWGFHSHKDFYERPHAFRSRFLNELEGYRQDERLVFDDGFDESNATLYEQIEVPGVTHPDTVWRHGRFLLAEADLRPEMYSLYADFEHLLCHRGGRIRVSHDVLLVGLNQARVTAVAGQVITLDEAVAMTTGSYGIRFRLADGTSLVRTVVTNVGESHTITLSGAGAVPAVGDLAMFGVTGLESAIYVVHHIEPASQETARIYFVDEAPGIHIADQGPIPPWDPQITQPIDFRDLPPPVPEIVAANSHSGYERLDDGTLIRNIAVSLRPGADTIPTMWFEAAYQTDGGLGERVQILPRIPVDAGGFTIPFVKVGNSVFIRARAVSPWEVISDWATLIHVVGASVITPGNPLGVAVQGYIQKYVVNWTPPADNSIIEFEVNASVTPNFINSVLVWRGLAAEAIVRGVPILAPIAPEGYFWVRAKNRQGDFSLWSPDEAVPGVFAQLGKIRALDIIGSLTGNVISNWSFELGNDGSWVIGNPVNVTIVTSALNSRMGTMCLQWLAAGTGTEVIANANTGVETTENEPWYLEAWAKGTNGQVTATIRWYNEANVLISSVTGKPLTVSAAYAAAVVEGVAPVGTSFVRFALATAGQTSGNITIDDVYGTLQADSRDIRQGSILRRHLALEPTGNAIENWSFELGDNGSWVIGDPVNVIILFALINARGGKWCLRYAAAGTGTFVLANGDLGTPATAGQEWSFEGWAKGDNGFVVGILRWFDADDVQIGLVTGLTLNVTTTYQPFRAIAIAPPLTSFVRFALQADGQTSGTITIDDVSAVIREPIVRTLTANLPTAASPGRVRLLEDEGAGVLIDQGAWWGRLSERIPASAFGVVPNDAGAGTLNQTRFNALLTAASASGRSIELGPGTFYTLGNHAWPEAIGLYGQGQQKTILRHTSITGALITMLSAGEVTVERAANRFQDLTFSGTGSANSGKCFDIKNKVNLTFDHIEVANFQYAYFGHRDNVANSVNTVSWRDCRTQFVKIGIYAPRQWNDCRVFGGQWNAEEWDMIVYDASGWAMYGGSINFPTIGGIFLGGCDGFTLDSVYCEGNPSTEAFIHLTGNKDVAGATTLNGIALNPGRSGVVNAPRGSSAGVTNYLVQLDGISGVSVISPNAGSGMAVAAVRVLTGTTRNVFIGGRSNPGTLVSYQTAADALNNFELDTENGGGVAPPRVPSLRIQEMIQGFGAGQPSKADLGNAAALAPTNLSANGILVHMGADSAHIQVDGQRDNDNATLNINFHGFQNGTTRFRDFRVYDGKEGALFHIVGSTGHVRAIKAADLGNATLGAPANRSAQGILAYMSGDSAHIQVDGQRANDSAGLNINFHGYQDGVTRFRDVLIYDGKGALLLQVDGSAALLQLTAALKTTGFLGFFNTTPIGQQGVAAAATDPATTQTLANSLRSILMAYGLAV